ncbi:uncharacterized protein L201_005225 [Kwoniella dendrophila CBS 6074]|uniref:Uncharacterized protein n=1 Tax=Kwoniella dendrophila CBS 6074 TaxID=1295534 RepID=A0AAX4JYF7_9TREE
MSTFYMGGSQFPPNSYGGTQIGNMYSTNGQGGPQTFWSQSNGSRAFSNFNPFDGFGSFFSRNGATDPPSSDDEGSESHQPTDEGTDPIFAEASPEDNDGFLTGNGRKSNRMPFKEKKNSPWKAKTFKGAYKEYLTAHFSQQSERAETLFTKMSEIKSKMKETENDIELINRDHVISEARASLYTTASGIIDALEKQQAYIQAIHQCDSDPGFDGLSVGDIRAIGSYMGSVSRPNTKGKSNGLRIISFSLKATSFNALTSSYFFTGQGVKSAFERFTGPLVTNPSCPDGFRLGFYDYQFSNPYNGSNPYGPSTNQNSFGYGYSSANQTPFGFGSGFAGFNGGGNGNPHGFGGFGSGFSGFTSNNNEFRVFGGFGGFGGFAGMGQPSFNQEPGAWLRTGQNNPTNGSGYPSSYGGSQFSSNANNTTFYPGTPPIPPNVSFHSGTNGSTLFSSGPTSFRFP